MSYYAVRNGREIGIFENWNETRKSVENFPGAKFKKFQTKEDAFDYINQTKKIKKLGYSEIKYPSNAIKVFTDGSCIKLNHPQVSYLAGYAVYFGPQSKFNYAGFITSGQTNQKVELLAIRKALEILKDRNEQILLFTDSMYSINCVTRWFPSWEKNNFLTTTGKPVKHLDIIQDIRKLFLKGNVEFIHINSHTDEPNSPKDSEDYIIWFGNKQADHYANLAAKKSADYINENKE